MPTALQQPRIDLADLKSQIGKKLGLERAQHYFGCLNRFLSQKLSKSEFDKLCFAILGKENISLHNQLVRSIFKNACQAKVPPVPILSKDALKPTTASGKKLPSAEDRLHPSPTTTSTPPIWCNGDVLPLSPRKCRSGVRDRKLTDRPTPLGSNGRVDPAEHPSLASSCDITVREDGSLVPCDLKRPLQHDQEGTTEQPAKRPRIERPRRNNLVSVHRKGPIGLVVREDCVRVDLIQDVNYSRSPLHSPLGIPFCPASVGGSCRPLPLATNASNSIIISNSDSGELYHTEVLRKRMEQIAEAQGLGAVTMDSANLLNNGLDFYLKRLIKSCIDIVGARSGHRQIRHPVSKQQPHGKIMNGILLGNHMHAQGGNGPLESPQESRSHCPVSLQDFKVAMELNPQQLGEDWSLLLEKICLHSFDK